MNQAKIGEFLKELRKEKGLTQEQVAEVLNVSDRSVSRWETGNNMPDISLLVDIAELYNVSIPEIIDGERKNEKMNEEVKETAVKLAEFSEVQIERVNRRLNILFTIGFIGSVIFMLILLLGLDNTSPYDFISGCGLGWALGMLIVGWILTSKYGAKLKAKLARRFK